MKQRLKKVESDKKKLEIKVTAKKGQLVEAREKLTERDRWVQHAGKHFGGPKPSLHAKYFSFNFL